MKKAAIFLAALLLSAMAFESGQYYNFYKLKPKTIENACAHYNPQTGEYTWGAYIARVASSGDDAMTTLENAADPVPTPKHAKKRRNEK